MSKKRLFSCTGGWQFGSQHITPDSAGLLLQNWDSICFVSKSLWHLADSEKTSPLKIHFLSGFCFFFFTWGLFSFVFSLQSHWEEVLWVFLCPDPTYCSPASLIMAPGDTNSQLNSLRLGRGGLGEYRQCLGRKEDESKQPGLNFGLVLGRHSRNRSTKWTKFYTLTSQPPPSEPNVRLSWPLGCACLW